MLPTQLEPAGARPIRPWPAERIEHWPIERLIPYANNARVHREADIDKLADAIRKWGWTMPVLVDEDGNLIAGHLRTAAAPRAGVTSIPVIVARGWSEAEKRAYRLADNQLAARASWRTALNIAKGLIFSALVLPLGITSVPALAGANIQMLPPVTEATKTATNPTPCPPGGSPNILTWDGTNPISCSTGVTV